MKREKKFEKVRHFGMLCIMVVMVLGMMSVPRTVTYAAGVPDEEPDGYYRIQWPKDNPQGYCNVHFVDENTDNLLEEPRYIDCVSENDVSHHDMDNVKCIWGDRDEQVSRLGEGYLANMDKSGWYINLLDLVSPPEGDFHDKFHVEKFDDYEFVRAYVGSDKAENVIFPYLYGIEGDTTTDGVPIMRFYKKYDSSEKGGNLSQDKYGIPANEKDIYLVFKEKTGPSEVTNTISNAKIGLNVYLFDYDGPDKLWGDKDIWIASEPSKGLYSSVLGESGFPVYQHEGGEEIPMGQYFNPDAPDSKANFIGTADNLFQYDSKRRVYYYNSARNAAYYDKTEKKFVLYDELVCPLDYTHKGWLFRRGAFQRGNFLPFNDINKNKVWAYNVDEGEQRATPVYGLKDVDIANYYFGMYMTGNIYQPEGGKINGESMIFNITGDDDILVYIDDVLVLDLGGIHDPLEGKIDFSTGEVTTDGEERKLKDIFQEASGSDFENTYGKLFNAETDTFADNSLHTIKVFYAERGAGASNLWVELNAPAPSITIKNNFLLDENGHYNSLSKEKLDIGEVKYILREYDATDNYTDKTISDGDGDFNDDGTYVFEDLDYTKKYVVIQELYDKSGNKVNGSTGEYLYEFTNLKVDGSDVNGNQPETPNILTPEISLSKDGLLLYPTVEFDNVYKPAVTGSIVIDNSFILNKTDGTTTSLDNAPNKGAFDNNVSFIVRNEEGDIVAEVPYSKFEDGKYTVDNLDVKGEYKIEITGIGDATGTEERSYVTTTIEGKETFTITGVQPKTGDGTKVSVVNSYQEKEQEKTGSIVIDNSFILNKTDGTTTSLDNAPNKEAFDKNVVFIVKDEDGKVVVEVPYSKFTYGKYTVDGLDVNKKYTIETAGIDNTTGTEERPYVGTEITPKEVTPSKAGEPVIVSVENIYTENEQKEGSIIIDNSFILNKTDGTTTSLNNAPNKEAFDKNAVFIVKDEDGKVVAEVKYSDFKDGKYTVDDLDVNKKYTIEVTGIDDKTGTEGQPYVTTTMDANVVTPSKDGTHVSVVNQYKEVDSSKENTNNPETGSIVIDNSFILNKTNGKTTSLDNAPNKEAFDKNVVFKVKDEDGKVVAEVPYSEFKDGKYTVDGLDVNKKYTIEITGIDDKTGTKERPYVTTTMDATVVTPSKDGTTVLVVNKYKEVDSSKKNSNKDKKDDDDDDDSGVGNPNKTNNKTNNTTHNTTNNTTTPTAQAAGTSATPKTGDNMNILLYVLLLLGAAGGLAGCIVLKKKME